MSNDLVSIIMPVYNSSRYLGRAVKSVLAQTCADWELLLIDDGSSDGSRELAAAWAKANPRINALHHPGHINRGVGATRNLGLGRAKGRYIAFLDSDDEWLPDKLAMQLRTFHEHPGVVLVYAKAVTIDQNGIALAPSRFPGDFPHICGTGVPGVSDQVVDPLIRGTLWMPCLTVMAKADAVRKVGGFDETLAYQIEDHLLFTLIANTGPVFFFDHVLARYRLHAASYTATTDWSYSMVEYYDRLFRSLPARYRPVISAAYAALIAGTLARLSALKCAASRERLLQTILQLMGDPRVLLAHRLAVPVLIPLHGARRTASRIRARLRHCPPRTARDR